MSPRRSSITIERDRHGRERFVRRSSSHRRSSRSSVRDRYTMAQERMEALELEIGSLQTRLSFEQRNVHDLQAHIQRLSQTGGQARHFEQAYRDAEGERARLDNLLYHEEDKVKRLEHKNKKLKDELAECKDELEEYKEKYRLMKRGVSQYGEENRQYKVLYEEKLQEAELLRVRAAELGEINSLNEGRIVEQNRSLQEKNRTISYFKDYLRTHGFRVEG